MAIARRFKDIPVLGVGIGLRHSLLEDTLSSVGLIDWLEITPENYMAKGGQALATIRRAKEKFTLVSHGVSLSLGSVDPWDEQYLDDLETLFQTVNPAWFSDHLCFGGIDGAYFNDLMPLPRTQEAVDHTVARIRFIQDRFHVPFLIENISYYLQYPDQPLSEAEFLTGILEGGDCGLLLDVNNVYVNARNHGFDPYGFLMSIPLERVVQIHVAGHTHYPEGIVDTHGNPVCEDVWDLLEWVLQRCSPAGVMLERDLNMPEFSELAVELARIRSIWDKTLPFREKETSYAAC